MTRITGSRLVQVLPGFREEVQQRTKLPLPQVPQLPAVEPFQDRVERGDAVQAGGSDPGEHHPAVFPTPRPDHEPRLDQAIEQPGHVRHGEHESFPHRVTPQPLGLGPAEDAKHIVLRGREAVGPEHVGRRVLDERRRPREAHRRLLLQRPKRLALLELLQDAAGHAGM
jgi:hypothetical protein